MPVLIPLTLALEVSLAVQEEVQKRFAEADKFRLQQVERARYEVDLTKRRYLKVDPENRLVAADLEAEWNRKLQALRRAEEEYTEQRERDRLIIDQQKRDQIMSLSKGFPELWRDPKTPQRERKRMARLLIEDVTLVKGDAISANVRFKGGATRCLTVPRTRSAFEVRKTPKEVVAEIDRLLDDHTYGQIAAILNEGQFVSGEGHAFDCRRVSVIVRAYRLRSRYTRLRARGLLTKEELAVKLGTTPRMVSVRRSHGKLNVRMWKLTDMGDYMYEDPDGANHTESGPVSGVTKGGAV